MSRDFATTKSNARTASQAASKGETTVLSRGIKVRGRVSGASDLRVDGDIEGDVKVGGSLELGVSGSLTGNVTAKSVVVEGALTGDVEAEGAVHIRAGARVAGNMNGAEIALEEGASFSGRIEADFELPDGLLGGGGPAARRRG